MAGRPSNRRVLAVWMNGEHVGEWAFSPHGGGHSFRYDQSWLSKPIRRPLSLSLPLENGSDAQTGPRVEAFFDNLLPDSVAIRKRLSHKFGTGIRAMDLLEKIGRDCVGAIQLLPVDEQPPDVHLIDAKALTDAQVERLLDQTISEPAPGISDDEDLRISIAGAQEKTALLWHQNQWCKPLGSTPTTHIFKLPLGEVGGIRADFSTSVENEWLCAEIARELGWPVANCRIAVFGRHKVLVVERFDRRLVDHSWWARLPQEDFCQVLGTASEQKYEEHGGPGMSAILGVLRGSENPETDRKTFLAAQLLFWLLAAPDGHAKNFSIFIESGGRYRLTPLYDIMSAWPIVGDGPNRFQWQKLKLAMAVRSKNAHYRMAHIQRRHWNAVAKANGMGEDFEPVIQQFITKVSRAVEAVSARLPAGFPTVVSESIFNGLLTQTKRLESCAVQ
ncbi:MAG: type II toxin-antitoxin system HipA family toxin [Steroidobacteraceae bacterium]